MQTIFIHQKFNFAAAVHLYEDPSLFVPFCTKMMCIVLLYLQNVHIFRLLSSKLFRWIYHDKPLTLCLQLFLSTEKKARESLELKMSKLHMCHLKQESLGQKYITS